MFRYSSYKYDLIFYVLFTESSKGFGHHCGSSLRPSGLLRSRSLDPAARAVLAGAPCGIARFILIPTSSYVNTFPMHAHEKCFTYAESKGFTARDYFNNRYRSFEIHPPSINFSPLPQNKNRHGAGCAITIFILRRVRDSNPWYPEAHFLSREAHSTALATLHVCPTIPILCREFKT